MRPTRADFRELVDLAIPVVTVQVGLMIMGVVDTIMVGHVSAADLAAVALGNLYFMSTAIVAMGILFSLDPLVAQAVGAGDRHGVARGVQRGLLGALVLGTLCAAVMFPAGSVLSFARQPDDVVPIASGYVRAALPGIYPFLAFIVFRQILQAMGRLKPIVITVVLANLVNLFLNWVLVFGHLGAPPMGAVGTGWASTLSRLFMVAALAVVAGPVLAPYLRERRPEVLHLRPALRMLRLGVPIGIQLSLEYWAFAATSLLMGLISTVALAGHQVAINMAALTFMVPLGIGQACGVLVGRAVGAEDSDRARRAAGSGLWLSTAFMTLTAVMFFTLPELLASIYTSDAAVLALAASLLPLAGVFQVADGLQVVASGALRGIGDTRAPMITMVMGFWLFGLPIGIWLAFTRGLGPQGLWWGLVAGLGAVAVLLYGRVRIRFARDLVRIDIEDAPPATPPTVAGIDSRHGERGPSLPA